METKSSPARDRQANNTAVHFGVWLGIVVRGQSFALAAPLNLICTSTHPRCIRSPSHQLIWTGAGVPNYCVPVCWHSSMQAGPCGIGVVFCLYFRSAGLLAAQPSVVEAPAAAQPDRQCISGKRSHKRLGATNPGSRYAEAKLSGLARQSRQFS